MLSRAVIIGGGAALLLLASSIPAIADPWGHVDCGQIPTPACELGAGKGGADTGHVGDGAGRARAGGARGGGRGGDAGGDHVVGGDRVRCSYVRSDYVPPAAGVAPVGYRLPAGGGALRVWPAVFGLTGAERVAVGWVADPAPGGPGAWYVYRCEGAGAVDAYYRAPVWIPDAGPGGPSAVKLAEQARSRLVVAGPRVGVSPVGDQLVNLPTWLWLDRAGWGPRSATAAVPGVSVTAVARPTWVSWNLGDGTSLTCPGPGTVFPAGGDPGAASPDCGHVYRRSSAGRPDQACAVTATVHWTVTWAGAGQSGAFPDMTTTSTAWWRVAEAQALGTGPG